MLANVNFVVFEIFFFFYEKIPIYSNNRRYGFCGVGKNDRSFSYRIRTDSVFSPDSTLFEYFPEIPDTFSEKFSFFLCLNTLAVRHNAVSVVKFFGIVRIVTFGTRGCSTDGALFKRKINRPGIVNGFSVKLK